MAFLPNGRQLLTVAVSSVISESKLRISIKIYCNYISLKKEMRIKSTTVFYGVPVLNK